MVVWITYFAFAAYLDVFPEAGNIPRRRVVRISNELNSPIVSISKQMINETSLAHDGRRSELIRNCDFPAMELQYLVQWMLWWHLPFQDDTNRLHDKMDFNQMFYNLTVSNVCDLCLKLRECPAVAILWSVHGRIYRKRQRVSYLAFWASLRIRLSCSTAIE